jgi:hypothetical protein
LQLPVFTARHPCAVPGYIKKQDDLPILFKIPPCLGRLQTPSHGWRIECDAKVSLLNTDGMKKIDLKSLELLGCDYKRGVDIYLDTNTGKIYKRKSTIHSSIVKGKPRRVDYATSQIVELVDGQPFYEPNPVLTRDN